MNCNLFLTNCKLFFTFNKVTYVLSVTNVPSVTDVPNVSILVSYDVN